MYTQDFMCDLCKKKKPKNPKHIWKNLSVHITQYYSISANGVMVLMRSRGICEKPEASFSAASLNMPLPYTVSKWTQKGIGPADA